MNEESAYESVNVHPIANLHNLDVVEVLTSHAGGQAANTKALVAALPAGQTSETSTQGEQVASTGSQP